MNRPSGIRGRRARGRVRPRPAVEALEERCLPTTYTVTSLADGPPAADGVLTLRGCLPTYYLKQVAQTSVAGLEGVERIVNLIQVVRPGR